METRYGRTRQKKRKNSVLLPRSWITQLYLLYFSLGGRKIVILNLEIKKRNPPSEVTEELKKFRELNVNASLLYETWTQHRAHTVTDKVLSRKGRFLVGGL